MISLEGASKIDPEEDTVFEGEADEAATESAGEAKVVMDEPSLELLHGSTVDYTTELIGSQFKIVDNPRATSNCGCGTSFDVSDWAICPLEALEGWYLIFSSFSSIILCTSYCILHTGKIDNYILYPSSLKLVRLSTIVDLLLGVTRYKIA